MTEYARRTARILLINDEDRVLLFDHDWPNHPTATHGWITPGGGADEGEDLPAAAVRELFEEVGLAVPVADLGPHVAFAEGDAQLDWVNGRLRDDFFLHRLGSHQVDTAGMLDYEHTSLRGHQWWSADELHKTDDLVIPYELASLLERLVRHDIPTEPVELPWHH